MQCKSANNLLFPSLPEKTPTGHIKMHYPIEMETMVITVNLSNFTNLHSKLGFLVLNHLAEAFSDLSILLKSLPKHSHPEPRHLQAKEKVDNIHSLGRSCGVPSGSGTISWFCPSILGQSNIAMENLIFPRSTAKPSGYFIAISLPLHITSPFNLSTLKAWTLGNNFHVGCIWYSYWHPSAQYKPIYTHNGTPHPSQHMAQQRHGEFCLRREIHINSSFLMIHRLPCLVHVGSSANCKALPNFGWLDQFWCGWSKFKHPKNRLRNP